MNILDYVNENLKNNSVDKRHSWAIFEIIICYAHSLC